MMIAQTLLTLALYVGYFLFLVECWRDNEQIFVSSYVAHVVGSVAAIAACFVIWWPSIGAGVSALGLVAVELMVNFLIRKRVLS